MSSIHLLMGTYVVSRSWVLWAMRWWARSADISSMSCFYFFRTYSQKGDCWVIWQFKFSFVEDPPYCLPQRPHQSALPPTVRAGSRVSKALGTLVISCVFDNSHSNRGEVISRCDLDLYVPDNLWHWAPFHILVDHLFVCLHWKNICLGPLLVF